MVKYKYIVDTEIAGTPRDYEKGWRATVNVKSSDSNIEGLVIKLEKPLQEVSNYNSVRIHISHMDHILVLDNGSVMASDKKINGKYGGVALYENKIYEFFNDFYESKNRKIDEKCLPLIEIINKIINQYQKPIQNNPLPSQS